ncbi:MAG: toprim domain-containing protein [Bacteroides sp.]|nr:toprim domain-containing protein [Bacteroides sp.]
MKIDYNKLKELGLTATTGKRKEKQYCPACHNERTNKRDKSLSVDWEKCIAHCHHCGKSFFFGQTEKLYHTPATAAPQPPAPKDYRKPGPLTNEQPLDENMRTWFSTRGIPAEVLTKENITKVCRTLPQTGNVERCIVFPYTVDGELINRKYRDGAKNFMLESGARLVPWRIDHIRDTSECIITEGEMDALAFLVAGRDDVVSVPNGAQTNLTFLDDFMETHFENKRTVYIAADTDTKGLELRAELVRRLGEERCRIVSYGPGCKDANELLMKGGVASLQKALNEAPEVPMEGVFTAADVEDDLAALFEKGLQKGAVLGMGELDDHLSVETGRLMIVTGIPGDGKSEFLDEVAIRLSIRYDWRCAWFSPENFPITLHIPKLMEKLVGKPFQQGVMSELEYESGLRYLSRNFFDILPEEGYRVDTILEKAEMLVRRKGIRVLILDPYNCLEHLIPTGQSETQYISEFLEKLRSFARRRQVLVILAAHPTKMKKDPATGLYPVPTMYDISGSASFFNKADFGLAIERNRTQGVTRIHVQKVKFRHLGQPGVASFYYNTHNGRFVNFIAPKSLDLPNPKVPFDNSCWLGKKLDQCTVQGEIFT